MKSLFFRFTISAVRPVLYIEVVFLCSRDLLALLVLLALLDLVALL